MNRAEGFETVKSSLYERKSVYPVGDILAEQIRRGLDNRSAANERQYGLKWTDVWDLIDNSGFGRKETKALDERHL
jgi:hypothetical protein